MFREAGSCEVLPDAVLKSGSSAGAFPSFPENTNLGSLGLFERGVFRVPFLSLIPSVLEMHFMARILIEGGDEKRFGVTFRTGRCEGRFSFVAGKGCRAIEIRG